MLKYFLVVCIMLTAGGALSQDSIARPVDTLRRISSPAPVRVRPPADDSIPLLARAWGRREGLLLPAGSLPVKAVRTHPFFRFTDPVRYRISIKKWEGKEAIFYTVIALLLFFAGIRNGFARYLHDLFRAYFQTTVKQRQVKEQLLQSPLPSLLLNVFFLLSIGMFLALLLRYFGMGLHFNFWILFLYCVLGLLGVYGIKFLSLKLLGWILQVSEAVDSYIFIVFTTNKIIGILLLPFLVLLAFTYGIISQTAMAASLMVIGGLLVYRYFLSFTTIRRQVHISFFHFLLYLCAFEVAPVLLINKLLFRFLGETS